MNATQVYAMLKKKIDSGPFGSPLVAASVAGMTDHDRVYVYTGDEDGYTSGNWYYWNGTAWTSGGVYNAAAVETDTTLTHSGEAADAKATGDAIDGVKENLSQIFDSETSPNFFTGYTQGGGLNNTTGAETDSTAYVRSDYIPIDTTKSTIYILRQTAEWGLRVFFYNSSKTYLSNTQVFNGSSTVKSGNCTIPENAAYIRTYRSTSATGWVSLSYTQVDEYYNPVTVYKMKDGVVTENNLDAALKAKVNSKLTGKTIAFFGDSIIGNTYDDTGVCAILAENTGATVINCAFGGTRIAYRYGTNDQYPYWNALSGAGLADAIASGTWTSQDDAITNMTGKLSYFADRLTAVKAVDWSEVDFIMWEYGTNDFMTEVALTGNDIYAYDYAYRHAIETLLTAYPNIRIIPVTPIYRWYQSDGVFTNDSNTHEEDDYAGISNKLTDFVEKAQEVSKEYQLPCIDDYYTLGANRYSRLAYFDSTDGTHPNANGRKRIAEHISAQLMSLV